MGDHGADDTNRAQVAPNHSQTLQALGGSRRTAILVADSEYPAVVRLAIVPIPPISAPEIWIALGAIITTQAVHSGG